MMTKSRGLIFYGASLIFCLVNPREQKKDKQSEGTHFQLLSGISFSDAAIPQFEIEIENQKILVQLDLGCAQSLHLSDHCFDGIYNKKYLYSEDGFNFRGTVFENRIFLLPEMFIQGKRFPDVKVAPTPRQFIDEIGFGEEGEVENGRVGWPMFVDSNLLIDFKNAQIGFADSLEGFHKKGCFTNAYVEIPFSLENHFIEIEVRTERGPLRCIVDSGCTMNILNHELPNGVSLDRIFSSTNHKISNSEFFIGEIDFGPVEFYPIPLTNLVSVDVILGMEFLKNRLCFFDFKQRIAYISTPE